MMNDHCDYASNASNLSLNGQKHSSTFLDFQAAPMLHAAEE